MYLDLRNFLQLPITCIQVWFTLSLSNTLKNSNKSLNLESRYSWVKRKIS